MGTAAANANMNDTRQPTGLEAARYYWGLPSLPILVARSSTTPWDGPPYWKSLIPAGRHDALAAAWGDESPLKSRIISCLDDKAIPWLSFSPIKLGEFETQHTHSLVLLISVDQEHMPQWNVAQGVIDQCIDILREFGVDNMECEMLATSSYSLAKLEALSAAEYDYELREDRSHFIPFPGAVIDSADNTRDMQQGIVGSNGTLGLTVQVTKRPTEQWLSKWQSMTEQERAESSSGLIETEDCSFIGALTCNHCVQSGPKSLSEFDPDTMRYDVHLPSAKYLHTWIEKLDKSITKQSKLVEESKARLRAAGWPDSDEHKACAEMEPRIRRALQDIETAEMIIRFDTAERDYIRPFEPRSVRTLGRVFYTPPIGLDKARKVLRDWALLEIFESKVEAGHEWNFIPLIWNNVVGTAILTAIDPTLCEKKTMKLQSSVIPQSEFRRGMIEYDDLSRNPESRQYVLGKYGAATGLTFGYCNNFKAVTRRPTSKGPEHIAEEYIIVGFPDVRSYDKSTRFSKGGDSGAVVWNLDGRPVGMVTGGEGAELGLTCDITYMTHLEDVFGMMADRGFGVSIVD